MMISFAALIMFFPISSDLEEIDLFYGKENGDICLPKTRAVIKSLVGVNGCCLVWEDSVEEQDLRGPDLGEDSPHGAAPVQLSEQGAGGQGREHLGHVRQEVKRVSKQHRFECRDGLHLRSIEITRLYLKTFFGSLYSSMLFAVAKEIKLLNAQ